jgi:molecular chaperone DnaJ
MKAPKEWFEIDYYAILSIEKFSNSEAITKAYRTLAKQLHPDAINGSENAFKELSSAYAVLGNVEKKALYDQCQRLVMQKQESLKEDSFTAKKTIIEPVLPNGANRRQRFSLKVTEAILGCQKTISVEKSVLCQMCDGQGSPTNSLRSKCSTCDGSGVLGNDGSDNIPYLCWRCHGRGVLAVPGCVVCHGGGTVETTESITVKIPPNTIDGQLIRVEGYGYASIDNGAGDLYLEVETERSSALWRVGNNLYSILPLTIGEAVLGTTCEVMGLEPLVLNIPPETQSGKGFILNGKGVPSSLTGEAGGDLYVTIQIVVPTGLDRKRQKMVMELDKFYETPVREDYHT